MIRNQSMVVLDPSGVTLGGTPLTDVRSIAIDRTAARLIEEWGDGGPFCAFVDVAEVRVTVKVKRAVSSGEVGAPVAPGEETSLVFGVAPGLSGAGRVRLTASCVVVGVTHELTGPASGREPHVAQTIELRGVGVSNESDPVVFEAEGGA